MSNRPDTAPDATLREIARHVFSRPAGSPHSICLDFAPETQDDFRDDADGMVLEIYSQLAILGCRVLWGNDFSILHMTREQYETLQNYMRSFGVELAIRCNGTQKDPWELAETDGENTVTQLAISVRHLSKDQK